VVTTGDGNENVRQLTAAVAVAGICILTVGCSSGSNQGTETSTTRSTATTTTAPPLGDTVLPALLLSPDQVKYADGTPSTVPQMAHDVVSFLSWAAEPNLDERHRMGFKVILFLIIAIGIFYAAKRKIWARVH